MSTGLGLAIARYAVTPDWLQALSVGAFGHLTPAETRWRYQHALAT
ncbi:hypothetical protein ACIOTI_19605 [Streptomyces sp. NPDC087843]